MITIDKKLATTGLSDVESSGSNRPLDLRVSVTDHCNLCCLYCRIERDCKSYSRRGEFLPFSLIADFAAVLNRHFVLRKVHLTGGEPLMRRGLERLIFMLAGAGIKDIALTTNAHALLPYKAATLRNAGLLRVNISLDSLSANTYRHITRGGDLRKALRGIDVALEAGLAPIKINTVVVRGLNDDEVPDMVEFALSNGLELRFIELMPIGPGNGLFKNAFVSSLELRERLTEHYNMKPLDWIPGASARLYSISSPAGSKGTVGFISSCSMPFCAGCNRLRLTANGRLLSCLARNCSLSLRKLMRSDKITSIIGEINTLLQYKRDGNSFEQKMLMAAIGG